jgi:hypothetical protein
MMLAPVSSPDYVWAMDAMQALASIAAMAGNRLYPAIRNGQRRAAPATNCGHFATAREEKSGTRHSTDLEHRPSPMVCSLSFGPQTYR